MDLSSYRGQLTVTRASKPNYHMHGGEVFAHVVKMATLPVAVAALDPFFQGQSIVVYGEMSVVRNGREEVSTNTYGAYQLRSVAESFFNDNLNELHPPKLMAVSSRYAALMKAAELPWHAGASILGDLQEGKSSFLGVLADQIESGVSVSRAELVKAFSSFEIPLLSVPSQSLISPQH